MGGSTPISRILIANNGIAAVKAIRSIKKWSYETFGSDKMIEFVVMATPEDMKANAEYIHLADEFVQVPGGSNNNNYANVNLITELAESTHCHAVWAGWGHASENPRLPDSLAATKSKVVWIGPPSSAMRALGDKIGSTLIAQSAGVPCMPWSGTGLTVSFAKEGIPDGIYKQSCVTSAQQAVEVAEKIGYPVMIKASEGGGGKGIRRVEGPETVAAAFRQVQGEVPGSPIFIMKLAGKCRHLEVQLLCDTWGNAIAVFGRDCSVQRRHQKIIEEGPVVAAPQDVWLQMERSAVRLAKEVGYVGAGTVEYLYMDDGSYCFLELNPRLQVEHPVTEFISGVNLPAAQLQIAMGIPLHRMRGIRRMYGESVRTTSPIDFDNRIPTTLPGHVIACRITAENPDAHFQPTSGVIQELHFRSTPDVWGYFSVGPKGGVHEFADSQFGHMFALGATREIARKNMVLALKELAIRGDIRTTIEYLRVILETEDFKKNQISTTWLEKIMTNRVVETEKPETHLAVVCGALFRAHASSTLRESEYMTCLLKGQLPPPKLYQALIQTSVVLIYESVKYPLHVTKSGPNSFDLSINGWVASADVHQMSDGGLLVLLDGKKHMVYGREFPTGLRLTIDSKTCLFHEEYDPAQLRSAMQGKLVQWLVQDGAHVNKGQAIAEVEVMKMYVTTTAPEAGVIKIVKPEGTVLEAGDLIAQFVLDDPDCVQKAELFKGRFPEFKEASLIGRKPHARLRSSELKLRMLLAGYELGTGVLHSAISTMLASLRDPELPAHQFIEFASTLSGRLPGALYDALMAEVRSYEASLQEKLFAWESPPAFPSAKLDLIIEQHLITLAAEAAASAAASGTGTTNDPVRAVRASLDASGLSALIARYKPGNHAYAVSLITDLLNEFLSVEEHFQSGASPDAIITQLRKAHKDDLPRVAYVARAHHQLAQRVELVQKLIYIVVEHLSPLLREFVPVFQRLASLRGKAFATIVLRCRQLLMTLELPSVKDREIAIEAVLTNAADKPTQNPEDRLLLLGSLIDQSHPIEDLIFAFFRHKKPGVRHVAIEVYIRRVFQLFTITSLNVVSPSFPASTPASSFLPLSSLGSFSDVPFLMSPKGLGEPGSSIATHITTPTKSISSTPSSASSSSSSSSSTPTAGTITNPSGALLLAKWTFYMDMQRPGLDDYTKFPATDTTALARQSRTSKLEGGAHSPALTQMTTASDITSSSTSSTTQAATTTTTTTTTTATAGTTSSADPGLHNVLAARRSSVPTLFSQPSSPKKGSQSIHPDTPLSGVNGGMGTSSIALRMRRIDSLQQFSGDADHDQDEGSPNIDDHHHPQHHQKASSSNTKSGGLAGDDDEVDCIDEGSESDEDTKLTTGHAATATSSSSSSTTVSGDKILRVGVMAHFNDVGQLKRGFTALLDEFNDAPNVNLNASTNNATTTTTTTGSTTPSNGSATGGHHFDIQPLLPGVTPRNPTRQNRSASRFSRSLEGVPVHLLYIYCTWPGVGLSSSSLSTPLNSQTRKTSSTGIPTPSDDTISATFQALLSEHLPALTARMIRRVTFVVSSGERLDEHPGYFTYRNVDNFEEDMTIRHIEPNYAMHMHLHRLANFDFEFMPTTNRMVHLFAAIPKANLATPPQATGSPTPASPPPPVLPGSGSSSSSSSSTAVVAKPSNPPPVRSGTYDGRRFFVRVLVRRLDSIALHDGSVASPVSPTALAAAGGNVSGGGGATSSSTTTGTPGSPSASGGDNNAASSRLAIKDSLDAHPETEIAFVEALNSLELAQASSGTGSGSKNGIYASATPSSRWLYNHVFVNVLVEVKLYDVHYIEAVIRTLTRRYSDKITRLNVTHVEFAMSVRTSPQSTRGTHCRFVCSNPTGFSLCVDAYSEQFDRATGKIVLVPLSHRERSPYALPTPSPSPSPTSTPPPTQPPFLDADSPYPVSSPNDRVRLAAQAAETMWIYDFIPLFEKAVRRVWRNHLVTLLQDAAIAVGTATSSMSPGSQAQRAAASAALVFASTVQSHLRACKIPIENAFQAPLIRFKLLGDTIVAAYNIYTANQQKTSSLTVDAFASPTISASFADPSPSSIAHLATLFPLLPETATSALMAFARSASSLPSKVLRSTELILGALPKQANRASSDVAGTVSGKGGLEDVQLIETDREPGKNDIGMVAWQVTLYTPECPSGRSLILIGNDITHQAGSFGPREDLLFHLASQRSRSLKIPRVYLGANSGARIGLAEEVRNKFKISWVGGNPANGLDYVYLTPSDYHVLKDTVICTPHVLDSKGIVINMTSSSAPSSSASSSSTTTTSSTPTKPVVNLGGDVAERAAIAAEGLASSLGGEVRYVINDIIGRKDGLGVENLRGSGLIAGETSQAYKEVFTLTYATGRCVGIGAYLARLGQRVIQKADPPQPLILTGYNALNKLLGRPVYSSNNQLGGPDIMFTNGVSHVTVANDLDGCLAIVQWLSYVPSSRGAPLPILPSSDPIHRQPEFKPTRNPYDPRFMLAGTSTSIVGGSNTAVVGPPPTISFTASTSSRATPVDPIARAFEGIEALLSLANSKEKGPSTPTQETETEEEKTLSGSSPSSSSPFNANKGAKKPVTQPSFQSGFFDKGSFFELLSGWARGVIVGRARLGGIPVGVVAVETRTVEQIIPADPAGGPESKEQVVVRAGQVWYPDSAYKTAQAIRDMEAEDLPVFIFANWRGFSGGMRDMFEEVLKYGSFIVDALRAHTQPVFVYIPRYGTLRGGAWVVVDPTINHEWMEMYSDTEARGGILETDGTVDVKFRKEQIVQLMHASDPQLKQLNTELASAPTPIAADVIKASIRQREQQLHAVYLQVANAFCDLHDTPGRMYAKGCLDGVVAWEQSRHRFYWRLVYRLEESRLIKKIRQGTQLTYTQAKERLLEWVPDLADDRIDVLARSSSFLSPTSSSPSSLSSTSSSSITPDVLDRLRIATLRKHVPLVDAKVEEARIARLVEAFRTSLLDPSSALSSKSAYLYLPSDIATSDTDPILSYPFSPAASSASGVQSSSSSASSSSSSGFPSPTYPLYSPEPRGFTSAVVSPAASSSSSHSSSDGIETLSTLPPKKAMLLDSLSSSSSSASSLSDADVLVSLFKSLSPQELSRVQSALNSALTTKTL